MALHVQLISDEKYFEWLLFCCEGKAANQRQEQDFGNQEFPDNFQSGRGITGQALQVASEARLEEGDRASRCLLLRDREVIEVDPVVGRDVGVAVHAQLQVVLVVVVHIGTFQHSDGFGKVAEIEAGFPVGVL